MAAMIVSGRRRSVRQASAVNVREAVASFTAVVTSVVAASLMRDHLLRRGCVATGSGRRPWSATSAVGVPEGR